MIVKLVDTSHEVAFWGFDRVFIEKLATINVEAYDVPATGAARRNFTVRLSKEYDASYKPLNTRPGKNDYPSFVVECGASESLAQLRNDA